MFEFLTMTQSVKNAFLSTAPSERIRAAAVEDGMRTLAANAIRTAVKGDTSVEEVLRVLHL